MTSLILANKILEQGIEKALVLNIAVNIAIVDSAGFLIAFNRMDKALLGAVDIAIRKAKTAVLFQKPSHILGEKSQPNGPLYGIEQTNGGLITFAGGLPIMNDSGDIIAAIGVSGSSIENDLTIAQAAIKIK